MTDPHPPPNAATPRPLQMGAKGAYIVRLLMVGDSACGKTSLVLRFDQNVFSTKFVTTIGVDYRDKMIKVCVCVGRWSKEMTRYNHGWFKSCDIYLTPLPFFFQCHVLTVNIYIYIYIYI